MAVFITVRDLDVITELDKEESLYKNHDKQAPLHVLSYNVGAIGPCTFEIENDICIWRFCLLVYACLVKFYKRRKQQRETIHVFVSFLFGNGVSRRNFQ